MAKRIFLNAKVHVSLKTVPRHRLHIRIALGSNCIMIGRRADMRTHSSIKWSSSFCVDASSIMFSGVVRTIFNAKDEGFVEVDCKRCIDITAGINLLLSSSLYFLETG